jgi:hypothetical protein
MEAFAGVAIGRARVFKTPFPELTEVAEENGIKLDFQLSGAFNEGDEEEIVDGN